MIRHISIRSVLLAFLAVLVLQSDSSPQCVVLTLVVEGEVHSDSKDAQVLIRVHANRHKRVSETLARPKADRFHAEIGFDTYVTAHLFGSHDCSRHPTAIDIILLVNGAAQQTVNLSPDRFQQDERLAKWTLKTPVVLTGRKPTSP